MAPTDSMSSKLSVSVVIPVYRGAGTLRELANRLQAVFDKLSIPYEIIFVNDASPDDGWAIIEQLVDQYPGVRGIDLMRNSGQHNALLCGVRAARHDVIITMDDDLQHPPECVPALLDKLSEGYDLVYGNPLKEPRSFVRNAMSRLIKRIILRHGAGQDVEISSFRCFRSSLRKAFESVNHPSVFLDLMLSWGGRRIGEIRLPHEVRKVGASSYTPMRLIRHAMNMITSFSVMPLHVASWLGFTFMLFGLLVLGYTLVDFLLNGRVMPGFTFLASIQAIFSGAQLFAVGILGLYLARVYEGMIAKPPYVIRNEIERGTSRSATRE